jgi:NAD(P)-dependent dehydrogenase (short-subunit alcohol dehydrogenase family)
MNGDQERKTLIVTGTTSGMGRAIAVAAGAAGYATVATVRDADRATVLEADARSQGIELDIRFLDITDHAAVTNFFGNLAVIRAVLPHLRSSRGRLITTTSANGVIGAPYDDAYVASKFALEGVMESIAPLVSRFGVKATIFEPGPVATDVMAPRRRARLLAPEPVRDDPYQDP